MREADRPKGWFHEPRKLQWIYNGFTVFMGLICIFLTAYLFSKPGGNEFLTITGIFIFYLIYLVLLSCKLDRVIGEFKKLDKRGTGICDEGFFDKERKNLRRMLALFILTLVIRCVKDMIFYIDYEIVD
jgi:hypothetical protein